MFWRLDLATCSRLDLIAKIACFAHIGQFLNVFSFPLNISDCLLSSSFQTSLKLTVSLSKNLHFCIISTSIFKKKVWVFLLSYSISCLLHVLSLFLCCCLSFVAVVIHVWNGFILLDWLKGFC